ncbi:fibronectin type III domain-containing protein [Listeria phage LP-032]|uniref:Fibronectin type III domain protein n=10 Tax=Homburgvirus TaxID=1921125 RepID=A0A6C0QZQ1_9CAUD|nr:fibronectin type III domain containing protein [Listeria phage LP-110]YP_008240579.1 fibronectin type III domain containing protein [Listeria phage LP-037]YP_009044190.1 fibronectin type III domain-containing protein [Listeria phage LP-026]YP_009045164.1 fibronectin type III domain-containing protein [Listeria phage LP-114]AHL18906.1 fibronectin type III domain-containing protein [Listeria phage LP-032]AWY07655.1 fibronectin type III domain containing protein [Listeria phage LP-KV022]QDK04
MPTVKKYDIKRNGNVVATYVPAGNWRDDNLLPNTNYQYLVRCHEVTTTGSDVSIKTSDWTNPINVKTLVSDTSIHPPAPINVNVTDLESDSFTIDWGNGGFNAKTYVVRLGINGDGLPDNNVFVTTTNSFTATEDVVVALAPFAGKKIDVYVAQFAGVYADATSALESAEYNEVTAWSNLVTVDVPSASPSMLRSSSNKEIVSLTVSPKTSSKSSSGALTGSFTVAVDPTDATEAFEVKVTDKDGADSSAIKAIIDGLKVNYTGTDVPAGKYILTVSNTDGSITATHTVTVS